MVGASFNYSYPVLLAFGTEVLASALLMAVTLTVVYTKGLRRLGGITIGGIVGLDIFFLSFISGAAVNPARSLAPALLSGVVTNLWLYWSATFIGISLLRLYSEEQFVLVRISKLQTCYFSILVKCIIAFQFLK
jgi:aquaporin Z